MSTVLLARHGQALPQSYTGHERGGDAGLSELGVRQAAALGRELLRTGVVPDVVISGGLSRQTESAQACLDAMGRSTADVELDPRWREYDVQPVLAAYSSQQAANDPSGNPRAFQVVLDAALRAWIEGSASAPGLIPWSEFTAAAPAALAELTERLGSGTTALVFTSAGPIAAVAAQLLRLDSEALLGLHRVVVNGSVTKLIHGSRGTHLLTFNEHEHLLGQAERLMTYR